MATTSKKEESPKKLTYEQLNDACNQLWQQNKQLVVKNRDLEQLVLNKRLDYLFRVVESEGKFSKEFTSDCIKEIEDAISIDQKVGEA